MKRFILDQMAILYSIITFDLKRCLGIFASHFWLIFNFNIILRSRLKNSLRYIKIDTIYEKSIVIDYFLKQKKYYSQIFK